VFGLNKDTVKTAIPQYLVDQIRRCGGWMVRERTGVHPVATGTRSRPNGSSRPLSVTQPSRREWHLLPQSGTLRNKKNAVEQSLSADHPLFCCAGRSEAPCSMAQRRGAAQLDLTQGQGQQHGRE
jgi:hypothetical protein